MRRFGPNIVSWLSFGVSTLLAFAAVLVDFTTGPGSLLQEWEKAPEIMRNRVPAYLFLAIFVPVFVTGCIELFLRRVQKRASWVEGAFVASMTFASWASVVVQLGFMSEAVTTASVYSAYSLILVVLGAVSVVPTTVALGVKWTRRKKQRR